MLDEGGKAAGIFLRKKFADGELDEASVIRKFRITTSGD